MRTYGRPVISRNVNGFPVYGPWTEVTTDVNGFNDWVYVTALAQVLQLNLGESPVYASWGIPSKQSVLQQIVPDFNVMQIQMQFSQYFSSLVITRLSGTVNPTYQVDIVTHQGVGVTLNIPIPQ